MALFGNDFGFFQIINDEFLQNIVEQEVLYYKINLDFTTNNPYGESLDKYYNDGVILNPLVVRDDQNNSDKVYGPEDIKMNEFRFYKQHLIAANLYCEKGDIINWHNEYYEVDTVKENQFVVGKSENTVIEEHTQDYGYSVSVNVYAKLIRPEKLNIIDVRS